MTKREALLKVYRNHRSAGYVPNTFLDIDLVIFTKINERPQGKDGFVWFGVD